MNPFVSVLTYAMAAACLYVEVLNRALMHLSESRMKGPVILAVFLAMVGGFAVAGWFLPDPPWLYVPLAVLGLVAVAEGYQAFVRHACAGSAPVDTTPHDVPLAAPVTTTDFVVHRYVVPHPKWHGSPLRIAHLTDLHIHPSFPLDYYCRVLAAAEQAKPDIAVFTGDFITKIEALPGLREVLRPIARLETFAVLGNHDYWAGTDAIRDVIRECGLRLLSDESRILSADGRGIVVTGHDHPWGGGGPDIVSARTNLLHIALSHTPDNIYRLARASVDMVFSGHYHAGQIRVPLFGSIVIPSVYGRRFDHGHFVVHGTHLFVASGVGAAAPPLRIYCQPDLFIVDIVPA